MGEIRGVLRQLLFPEVERRAPAERALRTWLRTIHIIAVTALVGGHIYEVSPERLYVPLGWTIGSGAAFVALELYGTFDWLFQTRGMLTILKLILLLMVPFCWNQRIWLILGALIIAAVSSHMSSQVRYYSFLKKAEGTHKSG